MLASLRAAVLKQRPNALPVLFSSNTHLGLFQFRALLSNTTRSVASKPSSGKGSNSFVVSYLIKSCGLSPQSALSASKRLLFKSLDNPNSVLNFLKEHGFSQTQISTMVGRYPLILMYNVEKTIMPKLELFRSKAISGNELTDTISKYPQMLAMSLDRTLIPCFDILKSVAQLDDKQVLAVLKQASNFKLSKIDSDFPPNIALLRELGVPQSSISYLVYRHPSSVFVSHAIFVEAVEKVKDLGFDPSKMVYVLAIWVVYRMTESKWASKYEVFGRYGWSREQVIEAFRYQPLCMTFSDKKISTTMDFLVGEIGWPLEHLVKNPGILFYSLEKRIKPRCLVVQALMSKGLVGKDLRLHSVLHPTEETFVKMFVTKFQETAPELLNLYKG